MKRLNAFCLLIPFILLASIEMIGQCDMATDDLICTEIMYNPCDAQGDDLEYEFIELYNRGIVAIDISNWTFNGITFTFPSSTTLNPGQYVLLSRNDANFPDCMGCLRFEYTGTMLNGGETICLDDCFGTEVFCISYDDADGEGMAEDWPDCADGRCASLVLIDETLNEPNLYEWDNWAPGLVDRDLGEFGTPGKSNETGCCILTATVEAECESENEYNIYVYFADGSINRDAHTIMTSAGSLGGDDPDNNVAGLIEVLDIPIALDVTLTITSNYGCDIEYIVNAPDCNTGCELELNIDAWCTDNDNANELYSLAIDVIETNPLSSSVDLYFDGIFFANYQHTDLPDTLTNQDGTDYETICIQAVDPFSEPKLTITELEFQGGAGGSCNTEYIEITNSGSPVDLEDYIIGDDQYLVSGTVRHIFANSLILETNETLHLSVCDFDSDGNGVGGDWGAIFNNPGTSNPPGDLAILLDPAEIAISVLPYDEDDLPSPVTRDPLEPTALCADTACFDEPCSPLLMDIEEIEFYAKLTESGAILEWYSHSEEHQDSYSLEFSSDGARFSEVHFTPARRNVDGNAYSFHHAELQSEWLFYRLKVIGESGEVAYSSIIFLQRIHAETVIISNPVDQFLHIRNIPYNALLSIHDNQGRELISDYSTSSQVKIDLAHLSTGFYYFSVQTNTSLSTEMFLKL